MRPVALRRIGPLLLGLGLLGSFAVTPVLAAGITVNSLLDTAADDGSCTLREAITAANTDTASGVAVGECAAGSGADVITFSVSGTISMPTGAVIAGDLSILGAGAIAVDGANSIQVFAIPGGTVTLSGLTITGGDAFFGAAVFNDGAIVTVTDSTISGNTAGVGGGGGIYNNGTMTITNSTITANSASGPGGGIFNNGPLTIADSTISGNTAGDAGGGIYNNSGTLAITDSTISGNTAGDSGGGVYNASNTVTVTGSTISGNAAGTTGGGIFNNVGGHLTVTTSTIGGNTADTGAGGGIFSNGILTVSSSTVSGNAAPAGGGGGIIATAGTTTAVTNSTISGNDSLLFGGGIGSVGTLALTNSTISGNSSQQGGGGIIGGGVETIVNSIIAGNSTGGNPSGADVADVLETTTTSIIGVPGGMTLSDILVPAGLADNGGPTETIALALVGVNPAIDSATGGTCAAAPINALDQRGMPRPAACDIGAYEAQPPTVDAAPNVSVEATSVAGAGVTYSIPNGSDEQGGALSVVCLPISGSTFPIGSTTVTCTDSDAVGHLGIRTFQVNVGAFAASASATISDAAAPTGTSQHGSLPAMVYSLTLLTVLSGLAWWWTVGARRRKPS
jgi:CSLREA domain-containing protein